MAALQGLFAPDFGQRLTSGVQDNSAMLGALSAGLLAHRQNANNPMIDPQMMMLAQAADEKRRQERAEQLEKLQGEGTTDKWLESMGVGPEERMAARSNPEIMNHYMKAASGGAAPDRTAAEKNYERAMSLPEGPEREMFMKLAGEGGVNVTVGDGMKLTEGQSKDISFYSRGLVANSELTPDMEKELTSAPQKAAGFLGMGGNYVRSDKYQQADRSAREFLAIILRKDSGAAVTDAEMALYGPTYLPQPGNGPDVIADKRRARARALKGIKLGLGTARSLADEVDAELEQGWMDVDGVKVREMP